MKEKKTILIVAMSFSVHTARWLEQIGDEGWDIHLFPSIAGTIVHPKIRNVTVHHLLYSRRALPASNKEKAVATLIRRGIGFILRRTLAEFFPRWRAKQLARVIRRLRPDVVHSMEIQAAGYLTLAAKEILVPGFPRWILTNWGSDIFFFGKLKAHQERIRATLMNCDYYSCECQRDVALAKEFGLRKPVLAVFPNSGGFDLVRLEKIRDQIAPVGRKIIMLKGYQNWAGRALVGLRALERCAEILSGYTVVIYSAGPDVEMAAERFTHNTGVPTNVLPAGTSHDEILSFHARARVSIGLSMSDAISTSLLEAMVMGSFPIQSCTACADEWIQHGISGWIVPPEDPDVVEAAIRAALTDDSLVTNASRINWQTALDRLDSAALRKKSIQMYLDAMA